MVYETSFNNILHKMSSLKTSLTKNTKQKYHHLSYNKKYWHFTTKRLNMHISLEKKLSHTCTINFFLCILCLINRQHFLFPLNCKYS